MIRPTHFTLLAAATLVTTLAAAILHASANRWSPGQIEGKPVLPDLQRQMKDVGAIELRRGDGVLTLVRDGEKWSIKERAGYPVKADKVRALLVQLTDAKLIEPKTSLKERLALLDLEDPTGKAAKSRLVRVLDGKSKVLSELVVGKSRTDAFGAGRGGFFMRAPAEQQAWLATGAPDVSLEARDWIDTQVFKIDATKLERVTFDAGGGAPIVVAKGAEPGAKFAVSKIPDGQKLKDGAGIEQAPMAFTTIDVEDVRKLAAPPTGDGVRTTRIEQAGGLAVTFRLRRDGANESDPTWVSIAATGDGDAKKLADEINARTAGWEFKVPGWKAEQIGKTAASIFEAATPPPAPAPPGAPAGGPSPISGPPGSK